MSQCCRLSPDMQVAIHASFVLSSDDFVFFFKYKIGQITTGQYFYTELCGAFYR